MSGFQNVTIKIRLFGVNPKRITKREVIKTSFLLFGGSLSLFCSVLSLHRFQQGSQSNDETTLGSNRCVLSEGFGLAVRGVRTASPSGTDKNQ